MDGCKVTTEYDDFNSHAHVERDYVFRLKHNNIGISTHTLTWSVTYKQQANQIYHNHFNSHAHVERDCLMDMLKTQIINFNSHAHVERDRYTREPVRKS